MKILTSVLKDSEIQNYIQENQDSSFEYLKNTFNIENIYNYIIENVNRFVVENDINSSYEMVKNFSKSYVLTILNEIEIIDISKDFSVPDHMRGSDPEFLKLLIRPFSPSKIGINSVVELDRYAIRYIAQEYANFIMFSNIEKAKKLPETYYNDAFEALGSATIDRLKLLGKIPAKDFYWELNKTLKSIDVDKIVGFTTFNENKFNFKSFLKYMNFKNEGSVFGYDSSISLAKFLNAKHVDFLDFVDNNILGKFKNLFNDILEHIDSVIPQTTKGRLLLAAAMALGSSLSIDIFHTVRNRINPSEEIEAVSVGTSITDSLENGDFGAVVRQINNKLGNLNTAELENTSYFKSFISFCDSAFEKLSSTSSDLWDRAKELASEHPYESAAILIFSGIGIVHAYSKKGSSGVLTVKGGYRR